MKTKGLHDIRSSKNLLTRPIPISKAGRLGELARLEQEKDRLRTEMERWERNRKQVEERLLELERRSEILQKLLEETPAEAEERLAQREQPRPAKRWEEISLEY